MIVHPLIKFSLARLPAFFLVIDFDFLNHERRWSSERPTRQHRFAGLERRIHFQVEDVRQPL